MLQLSQGSTEIMFIFSTYLWTRVKCNLSILIQESEYKMLKHVVITVTTVTMIATKPAKQYLLIVFHV